MRNSNRIICEWVHTLDWGIRENLQGGNTYLKSKWQKQLTVTEHLLSARRCLKCSTSVSSLSAHNMRSLLPSFDRRGNWVLRVSVVNHMPHCLPQEKTVKMREENSKQREQLLQICWDPKELGLFTERSPVWLTLWAHERVEAGPTLHRAWVNRVRSLDFILSAMENPMRISNREMTFCLSVAA